MNNLANLTQKLKLKPVVEDEEDIEVAIIPEQPILKKDDKNVKEIVNATNVVADKDDGTAALDIFKRLYEQRITEYNYNILAIKAQLWLIPVKEIEYINSHWEIDM